MKKFFTILVIICIINLFNPMLFVCAKTTYKDVKNTNFQITETDKKYGLKDKSTNTVIFPVIYKKIKVLDYENKKVFYGDNENYMSLYSPDGLYSDFFKKYFDFVNKDNNIKFFNYPSNGAMKYYKWFDNTKYGWGLIIAQDGVLHITKPLFKVINFPDENSMVFNVYNISFAPLNTILCKQSAGSITINAQNILDNNWLKNDNPFIEKLNVEEDIEYKNNNIYVTYKDISVKADKIIKGYRSSNTVSVETIKSGEKQKFEIKKENIDRKNFEDLNDVLDYIEKCGIKFETRPKHIIQKVPNHKSANNTLYIYEDNKKYELSFYDFKLTGVNRFINDMTGLNLSFQNPDNIMILSGSGDNKIINKNGTIKINSDNYLRPLDYQYKQNIYINNGKLVYSYTDTTKNNNYISYKDSFSNLDNYAGIVNQYGNYIIPLTKLTVLNNNGIEDLKSQISQKTISDNKSTDRKRFWHNLPRDLMLIPILPFAIIFPPLGFALFMGMEDM